MVYSRKVQDQVLEFEASGALYHAALVMEDNQSGSFWAIMSSSAIGGPKQGAALEELPISEKTTWAEWRKKHPQTTVLSINSKEHLDTNPYDNYFQSDETFRAMDTSDLRLDQKASLFAFNLAGTPFVMTHEVAEGGWLGQAGTTRIFIYRSPGDPIYRNTKAYLLDNQQLNFHKKTDSWRSKLHGKFDPKTGRFENNQVVLAPLPGFDTFWYIWSQYHPKTQILQAPTQAKP